MGVSQRCIAQFVMGFLKERKRKVIICVRTVTREYSISLEKFDGVTCYDWSTWLAGWSYRSSAVRAGTEDNASSLRDMKFLERNKACNLVWVLKNFRPLCFHHLFPFVISIHQEPIPAQAKKQARWIKHFNWVILGLRTYSHRQWSPLLSLVSHVIPFLNSYNVPDVSKIPFL